MQQSGQTRHTFRSPAVALFALLGLVVTSGVGCDGSDSTDFPTNGGTGGSAGRAGNAGTGGRAGNGGTSGTGGTGTGGTGGSAGTGGSSAGTGGSSAGTGGSNDGDAGVTDAAVTDSGPPTLTAQQMADAICTTMDELVGCEPSPTCSAEFVGNIETLNDNTPACTSVTNAYFTCWAGEPVASFFCDGSAPSFATEGHGCVEEDCAFLSCQVGSDVCP